MSFRKSIDAFLGKLEKSYVHQNRIEISRSALLHNLHLFKNLANMPAIPVLKGNAYGHGIAQVATALKGTKLPYIAVDGYFEALRIREVSHQPVLIMGAIAPVNFRNLNYHHFAFVVQDKPSIEVLAATGKKINVHLEINTGMNRYGVKPDDAIALAKLILTHKNLQLEGLMSHLADSDGDNPATINAAVAQFDSCVEAIKKTGANPRLIHIAQSAGSLRAKSKYANAFRLGIGLYGVNPFPPQHPLYKKLAKDLRPTMRFTSTITKTINLKKGDKVSYNYTFTAPRDMRIGVIPVGYYEGVNRALSNSGQVKISNDYAPIVGRVCMNHTMVSLANSAAQVGDEVIIYSSQPGDKNTIDAVSAAHNLFSYNLLTSLSSDVARVLVV